MLSKGSSITCPALDTGTTDRITLAHGEGGLLMRRLIRERILPAVGNEILELAEDAAVLPACKGQLAMTTDSFVVSPLFFSGGDIGSLSVYGTVNDLVVCGAKPLWISLGLILEEGLEIHILERVLSGVALAARQAGVKVVTGDTKVVPRGTADKMFINTTGVGEIFGIAPAGPRTLQIGDELIVTGPIGQHGMAVMVAREDLAFEPTPLSDSAPLIDVAAALQRAEIPVRSLRDATRGGVAAVLQEWADASNKTLLIKEESLPVTDEVRGACELLGLDPIHVANEGTMVVAVQDGTAWAALDALASVPQSSRASLIGKVEPRGLAPVVVERLTGSLVPLDEPIGAPLPRIC